jgi:hypothetical protein
VERRGPSWQSMGHARTTTPLASLGQRPFWRGSPRPVHPMATFIIGGMGGGSREKRLGEGYGVIEASRRGASPEGNY